MSGGLASTQGYLLDDADLRDQLRTLRIKLEEFEARSGQGRLEVELFDDMDILFEFGIRNDERCRTILGLLSDLRWQVTHGCTEEERQHLCARLRSAIGGTLSAVGNP